MLKQMVDIINQVGFPIFVAVFLLIKMIPELKALSTATAELNKTCEIINRRLEDAERHMGDNHDI